MPHHSWVYGEDNVSYLEKRYQAMKEHFMFDSIEFTKEISQMEKWFPLLTRNRDKDEVMAASRIERGTEVNYGALTEQLFKILEEEYDTPVYCNKEVLDVDPDGNLDWSVKVKDKHTSHVQHLEGRHIFIGAGGGSLLLLQKAHIKGKEGYGGFPISGAWLVCKNPEIIKQHHAKVYSKAGIGDPPMSVPHLDTRYINGKQELLFGPFAGFSPKFLKKGSKFDLFKSIKYKNLHSMWGVFWHNLPLTKYLIKQVSMSFDDRMNALRHFIKDAKNEDWEILVAGQRVQTIKKDVAEGGVLEFGTEIVRCKSGQITCLLGASPGASTSVSVMLDVLEHSFPDVTDTENAKRLLKEMVPFWNNEVSETLFNTELKQVEASLSLKKSIV